ncbi:hypothetical protein BD769DRAFT_1675390 [Suillus cothurnatus]|nr:hypothetical protein BD769DRAFT_1675390 [Suillus cothurnatus]
MTHLVDVTDEHVNEIVLSNWDISVILAFAGSRLRACLTYLQREDRAMPWPSERVGLIRAGLHWEIESFVLPFVNYAVSHSMVPTPAPVVQAILGLFSQNLLCHVPDHKFTARLRMIDPLTEGGDPSRMVDEYDYEWWVPGLAMDLAAPLPWISVNVCMENHVRQWPEGSAYVIPSPQTELGEFPFRAQLLLLLERLDLNLLHHIAALRRSHSSTPSWHPTASPVLSPRESSSDTTEAFDSWDWTHFGASPGSSHTSGKDRRVGSGSTHTAAPRQVESLSLQTSDGLSSRPGYTTSSSNTFNSTSLSNTPPHPPYRSSPSISSSARANASIRESDAFPSGSLTSVPSVLQAERNNIDASNEPDGRQGIHNGSSSGSSNLSWAALASSRPSPPVASSPDVVGRQGAHRVPSSGSSNLARATLVPPRSSPPVAPSPDVVTCPVLLDSIFGSLTSDVAARPQAVGRTTHSDASWRSMSSALMIVLTKSDYLLQLGDFISHFYAPDEEQYRDTSNTIQDYNPPSPRSTDRYQEVAARARTVIERSLRPISEASASFSREQAVEDSDEAGLSFDRYLVGLGEEDSIDRERWRRVTAHNRYNLAGDNDEDSYPDSVHEIIRGLRNARGLLERGVETARSLSVSPSRHEPPNPPPTRYRCHSRLYASATTVSSNSLVSESAAEHRRTNARTHLRSQLFGSRPNSDEPRDSSDISNLTVTARLRRLIIASQADSSSNTSSRILSSGRTSDLPSRQFALNGS